MKIAQKTELLLKKLQTLTYTMCVNTREDKIKNASCRVSWMSINVGYLYAVIGSSNDIILVLRRGFLPELVYSKMCIMLQEAIQEEDPLNPKQYVWNHIDSPFL